MKAENKNTQTSNESQGGSFVCVIIIVAMLIMFFSSNEAKAESMESYIKCVASGFSNNVTLKLREGASKKSKIIGEFELDREFEVIDSNIIIDEKKIPWLKVKDLSEGKIGYVAANLLMLVPSNENERIGYTNSKCSIRKSESSDGEILKELKNGERILIQSSNSKWSKVLYKDSVGFSTGYLENLCLNSYQIPDESSQKNVVILDMSYCQRKKISSVKEAEQFFIKLSQKENFGGAIFKAAYRGALNTGIIAKDKMYEVYARAAENVGCPFGLYVWTEAYDDKTANEEIEEFSLIALESKEKYRWFKLPICVDSETYKLKNGEKSKSSKNWTNKAKLTEKIIEGIEKKTGEEVLLYTCKAIYKKYFAEFRGSVWIAHYNIVEEIPYDKFYEDYRNWNFDDGNLVMWQFNNRYKGYKVDVNVIKKEIYDEWIA